MLAPDQSNAKNGGRQIMIITGIEAHNKIEIDSEKNVELKFFVAVRPMSHFHFDHLVKKTCFFKVSG